MVGLSPVGRGLIHPLELNASWRMPIRRMEQDQGEFPPPEA